MTLPPQPSSGSMAARHSTAHYLLEALLELGIDHIFANLGTDHVSLIEEIARWQAEGRHCPHLVLCPHENVAVHMAGGYAAVTGRAQAVLVHVDVGSANAALGLHNLFRRRTPLLLLAGRAPVTLHGEMPGSRDHYVHYMQDPFDIASLVRPFVKWEYDLAQGINVKEVLRRMHSVAQSAPAGPAYLTMTREVLAQDWPAPDVRSYAEVDYGAVHRGGCAPETAGEIARRLHAAHKPVVVTSYLGRSAEAVRQLEALALEAGICVIEYNVSDLNLRRDAIVHGGFDPGSAIDGADLILLLDVDVPWLTQHGVKAGQGAWIAHIDVDVIKQGLPMWGFPSHLRLEGECAVILRQVREALGALPGGDFPQRVQARIAALEAAQRQRSSQRAVAVARHGERSAIGVEYLCHCLDRLLRPEDVVVNEGVRNAGAVLNHIGRTLPGTYISSAGVGLGYSGAMALGIRLALPDRRIVQIVGDGSFHLGTPTSVYAVAQQYDLPILTVVLDNGGWAAVKNATLLVYPDGVAADTGQFQSRLAGPVRRFGDVAAAFGAYGEAVEDPADLAAALERCLRAIEQGRSALLQVAIGPH